MNRMCKGERDPARTQMARALTFDGLSPNWLLVGERTCIGMLVAARSEEKGPWLVSGLKYFSYPTWMMSKWAEGPLSRDTLQ